MRLNGFPCPDLMPTAAWTSSCARTAAICAGMASGACARSGRMKISKWPSALRRLSQHSPIARLRRPALVKPIATRTRSGRGAPNASNSGAMPAATPFSQLSRLSCIMLVSPSHRRRAMASAIGPAVAGERGRRAPFPSLDGDPRRRRRRPCAGLKPARARDRRPVGTRRHGRLGRSAAEIERGPLDAPKAAFRARTIDNYANACIFCQCPDRPSPCVSSAIPTTCWRPFRRKRGVVRASPSTWCKSGATLTTGSRWRRSAPAFGKFA